MKANRINPSFFSLCSSFILHIHGVYLSILTNGSVSGTFTYSGPALSFHFRSISALIGIPNAAMLELTYPLQAILTPCAKTENFIFDLARCSPSWSEDVDFGVLLIKVSASHSKSGFVVIIHPPNRSLFGICARRAIRILPKGIPC